MVPVLKGMTEVRCSELGVYVELLSFGPLASIEGGDDMQHPKLHSMVQANVGNAIGVLYMLTLVQYGRMIGPRETGDSMSPCRQLVGYVCPRASPMSSSAGCHICMSSGVFVSTNCSDARSEIYDRLKKINEKSVVSKSALVNYLTNYITKQETSTADLLQLLRRIEVNVAYSPTDPQIHADCK
eukprot:GHVR01172491.1.p1 GENE.GHVR01172491.1~~GHVR01172491.1.p1  ORF type:complete len:184 (-),score=26.39 GHVR01172491.1:557-1108(-)